MYAFQLRLHLRLGIEARGGRARDDTSSAGHEARHDGASAVSTLNERGALRGAPPELRAVLSGAVELHRVSRGAFDVTVKPGARKEEVRAKITRILEQVPAITTNVGQPIELPPLG